jgi:hypothetical protein
MYPQGGATPVAPVNWERKKMHGKSKSNAITSLLSTECFRTTGSVRCFWV